MSWFVFSESSILAFFSSCCCCSFGPHVISGSKSIWLRWKFSISLAWSNGALLTGGGNRKSFRPSSSHTLKRVAESCSEWGRLRRRDGAKETREERRGEERELAGAEILMRLAEKKKSTKCEKDRRRSAGRGGKLHFRGRRERAEWKLRLVERNRDTLGNQVKLKHVTMETVKERRGYKETKT